MIRKDMFKKLYIISIFFILCFPVGLMGFYKSENTENRDLASRPAILSDNFGKEFESYIADNFAFRDILVNANNILKSEVFGLSGNEKVTVGKEGWLFYTETLDDVMSKNTMTDREIYCTVRTLEIINDYVKGKNARFIFMIAPNKASLYNEYLPYYYIKSNTPNNVAKISKALKNIDYIDLTALFEKQDDVLYHKLDSHWNNKGALLVTDFLVEHLGLEKCTYSEPVKKQDWDGDLYKMLFPAMNEKDAQFYYNKDEFHYNYTKRFRNTDDMIISTANSLSENGNILIFRDSFGRSMLPFLAEAFSEATLLRAVPYNLNQMENNKYNYVVFEICERNLENIILKAPYMNAPEVNIEINSLKKLKTDDYNIVTEKSGNFNHIYGEILTHISDNSRIYLSLGEKIYEAFPCFESEDYKENDKKYNGFSLYTDKQYSNIDIYVSK